METTPTFETRLYFVGDAVSYPYKESKNIYIYGDACVDFVLPLLCWKPLGYYDVDLQDYSL